MKLTNYALMLAVIFSACKGKETSTAENTTTKVEKVPAICISNGVPVREEPSKDGKWLTSLNLGESMVYLGEEYKDSTGNNKDFYKVELSDGSQVWARTYGILLNAKGATILSETPIYKRPDLVNKTDKNFNPLEFVAIIGEKDDWVEVVGSNKRKSGWIKVQYTSTNPEDVAVATLAFKSLLDKDGVIIDDKLAAFVDDLPYENTRFNGYLNNLLDEKVGGEVEESITNYEGEGDTKGDSEYEGD